MQKGTVKWFNPTKGYGFIKPMAGDKDVFVHISAVERAGLTTLNENQVIEYDLVENRGKTEGLLSFVAIRASNPDAPLAFAGGFCFSCRWLGRLLCEHPVFARLDDADHRLVGWRRYPQRFAQPWDRAVDGVHLTSAAVV